MTQRLREWFTPSTLIHLVGLLVSVAVALAIGNHRLDNSDQRFLEFRDEIRSEISELRGSVASLRDGQGDVIRMQERIETLKDRIQALERANETQIVINGNLQSRLAGIER